MSQWSIEGSGIDVYCLKTARLQVRHASGSFADVPGSTINVTKGGKETRSAQFTPVKGSIFRVQISAQWPHSSSGSQFQLLVCEVRFAVPKKEAKKKNRKIKEKVLKRAALSRRRSRAWAVTLLNPLRIDHNMFVRFAHEPVVEVLASSQLKPGEMLQWQDRGWSGADEWMAEFMAGAAHGGAAGTLVARSQSKKEADLLVEALQAADLSAQKVRGASATLHSSPGQVPWAPWRCTGEGCCQTCPSSHPYCTIGCPHAGTCTGGCASCVCTCAGEPCCYKYPTIPCPA